MKKQLLSLVMMLLPMVSMADAVEIDGIYYNLNSEDKVAEVTSNPNKYIGYVNIPESVTYEGVKYNVTAIGNSAFYNCKKLDSITIPNGVTEISGWSFDGCTSLTSIDIPNSVIFIGKNAFEDCI